MAGDVDDLLGLDLAEEVDAFGGAAGAGGIEDDGFFGGGKFVEELGEEFFGAAGDEFAVGDVFVFGVFAGGFDGGEVEFDADEFLDEVSGFEGEEADAAVDVDDEFGGAGAEAFADACDEFGEEEEVVLEKGVAGEGPVFGGDAEGDFDAAFVGRVFADVLDLAGEFGLGDVAFLDVDDEAVVVADEADVEGLFEFVPLAADHDAVAVAVGLGTGDDLAND